MAYSGPWPLTQAAIDNMVKREDSPGTYYIGRKELRRDENGEEVERFIYVKVGRDDVCVKTRLKSYVNNAEYANWKFFKFRYWGTPEEAFAEESRVFHLAPGPKNKIHPARPDGRNIHCPVSQECFPDADDDDDQ